MMNEKAMEESSHVATETNAPPGSADVSRGGVHRQIEMVSVDRLAPYQGNARTHTKKQIRQLAKSIERFGFTNPLLVDDGGQIIAGHGGLKRPSSSVWTSFQA